MEKKGWKITAITFIILFIFIISYFIYALLLGLQIEKNEIKCSMEICEGTRGENYDSYQFDYYNDICYCYKNHEIVKTRIMD